MIEVAGVWRCCGYGVSRNDRGVWRVALLRIVSENCCGGRKYRSSLKLLYCCDDLCTIVKQMDTFFKYKFIERQNYSCLSR